MNMRAQTKTVSMPIPTFTPRPTGLLQRKCACGATPGLDGECAECRKQRLSRQRHSTSQAEPAAVPPIVHDVLRSPGQPLEPETRAFMETRFSHDFSWVQVHTDARAAESARAVNALAYTVGRDIVFGAGQYAPERTEGKRLLAHELTHIVQQASLPQTLARQAESLRVANETHADEHEANSVSARIADGSLAGAIDHTSLRGFIQRAPDDNAPVSAEPAKDPVCTTFDFNTTSGLASAQASAYVAKRDTEPRLALIRTLKLIRRCATPAQQKQVQDDLAVVLDAKDAVAVWDEAGTPFGGYRGMYPGYASDIKRHLTQLGASETVSFGTFELTSSGPTHRSRAKRVAAGEVSELARTDIIYFRGHQFAQYRAPGVFSDGNEEYGFDLRYIEKTGGFPHVKLMISTSCATLCKEAVEVFHGLFPNAVILGYRKSAPLQGAAVRDTFQSKIKALSRPLLLDQPVDVSAIISAWKSVIEEKHAGDTNTMPGYYDGTVHYWDGTAWQSIGAMEEGNKCKRKEDFSSQYPAPR
jgi:hypothetical protein